MKLISVVTPCFNEQENVVELYRQIKSIFTGGRKYLYEHIFIDNCSTDQTVNLIKEIAAQDKNVKLIVNSRNFGHIRSPYHAILQTRGDAVITMAADLQDPPALLPDLLKKWEEGACSVVGVKEAAEESRFFFAIRKTYYRLVRSFSDIELIDNFTGFGLYDKKVVDALRAINDPYPYFRGQIAEIGFSRAIIKYKQPLRKRGITKNNFYTLYDMAMLGFVNHSKVPLRLAIFLGFTMAGISLLVAFIYLIYKLLYWSEFSLGSAPLVVGLFFFSAVQLIFIGILGEYIGAILTQVKNKPLVIEKERINF